MMPNDEYEERGFLKKYGFVAGIGLVILCAGGLLVSKVAKADHNMGPRMQQITILPPPPPPQVTPPPKLPDPPKEVEKMIDQTPMDKPEEKPDDSPKDTPALTTSMTGRGNDGFGLGGGNGGGGGHHGGGSRWGWYASELNSAIHNALTRSSVVSMAEFSGQAKIWTDESGRVTRIKLSGSIGDAALDRAIEETVVGLQLPDPPPKDMPMPILMRIAAHRPS